MKAKLSNKQCLIHKTLVIKTIIDASVFTVDNFNSFRSCRLSTNRFQGQSSNMLHKPNLDMLTEAEIDRGFFGFRVWSLFLEKQEHWTTGPGNTQAVCDFTMTVDLWGEQVFWSFDLNDIYNGRSKRSLHVRPSTFVCLVHRPNKLISAIGKLRIITRKGEWRRTFLFSFCVSGGGKRVGGCLDHIHRKTPLLHLFGIEKF